MLLVQISDLHCGPLFRKKVFETAVKEINELRPDVVLVTGDLTEEGLMSEFKMAQKELGELKAEKIIYVSGNHDYRSTGYLLFKEYFPFLQVTELDDVVIAVLSSARPDRNDGEIGHRQNLWLERTLEKYKDKIKIVLCGHRHRPWKWKLEDMQVLHAGSVSCEKLRGFFLNSYNVIEINNRTIEPKLKIVGGEFIEFNEIVKRREILEGSDISKYGDSLAR